MAYSKGGTKRRINIENGEQEASETCQFYFLQENFRSSSTAVLSHKARIRRGGVRTNKLIGLLKALS